MRIVVESSDVVEKSGKKKDGSNFSLRIQEGWVYLGRAHPERIELPLWEEDKPYSVGEYTLDPSSFIVNRYNNLELKRSLKLSPAAGKGVK
jgi:hypothetical protein